jgi:hypothetical protein
MQGLWKNDTPIYKKDSRRKRQKRKHFIKDKMALYYKNLDKKAYKKVFGFDKEITLKTSLVKKEIIVYRMKFFRYTNELIKFDFNICNNCSNIKRCTRIYCDKLNLSIKHRYKREMLYTYAFYDPECRCYVDYFKEEPISSEFIHLKNLEEIGYFYMNIHKKIYKYNSYYSYGKIEKFFYGRKTFLSITTKYHLTGSKKYCKKIANKKTRLLQKKYLKNTIDFDKGFAPNHACEKSIAWCID